MTTRREPDQTVVTTDKSGVTQTTQVFELGHWEAMQIAVALDRYTQTLTALGERPELVEHTHQLSRIFGFEGLYSITRKELS
jgi:hypothetical protein